MAQRRSARTAAASSRRQAKSDKGSSSASSRRARSQPQQEQAKPQPQQNAQRQQAPKQAPNKQQAPSKGSKRARTIQEAARNAASQSAPQKAQQAAKPAQASTRSQAVNQASKRQQAASKQAQQEAKPAAKKAAARTANQAASSTKRSSRQQPASSASSRSTAKKAAADSSVAAGRQRSSRRSAVSDSSASTRSSARTRVSGRQSARMESQGGGMLVPMILGVLILGGLGAGGWYLTQGEDYRIQLTALQKSYQKAYNNMQESIEEGSIEMSESYYEKGQQAIAAMESYVATHQADFDETIQVPNTKKWQGDLEELNAALPNLKKVAALRKEASKFQIRLNGLKRIDDLGALSNEIKDFVANPTIDGVSLDPKAMGLFKRQVKFLQDADAKIDQERERRKVGFEKPRYKADNRNDLQKRGERSAYQTLKTNIPHKLGKNKFIDAYKTAMAFHDKYPSCDIDEEWEKIVVAEDAYWSKCKDEVERLIAKASAGSLQSARSKLEVYFEIYGNESYGDQARKLYVKCKK